jgi:HEAT repeat protein
LHKLAPDKTDLAVRAMIAELKDKDPYARDYAARSLGNIGPGARAAIPALQALRDSDPCPMVVATAKQAIEKLSIPEPEGVQVRRAKAR